MCALQSLITSITAAFQVFRVFNHCCVSGYFGCEGLKGCDLLQSVAQRSMSRTKQSMYIERARTHTRTIFRERARTHTHTPYILQKAHAHHIFYRRGDNAQNIPRRTYTPQSSIANAACKVRAPHLPGPSGILVVKD